MSVRPWSSVTLTVSETGVLGSSGKRLYLTQGIPSFVRLCVTLRVTPLDSEMGRT